MFVSAETLTIVLSAVGIVLTLGGGSFAGLAWVVRRIDAVDTKLSELDVRLTDKIDAVEAKLTDKIDAVEAKLTEKIDAVETKLTEKIDAVDMKLSARIDALALDVTEVKISLARIEGPARQLLVTGRVSG
jgi:hypothetical protein